MGMFSAVGKCTMIPLKHKHSLSLKTGLYLSKSSLLSVRGVERGAPPASVIRSNH